MKILLFLAGILAIINGLSMINEAKSVMHQNHYMLNFILGAVCLSGAGIIEAIHRVLENVQLHEEETDHTT